MKISKSVHKKTKALTADELDAKFERGEDMSEHVNWGEMQKFINVPFPVWMISAMNDEAKHLGINRQALIKVWIAECIERAKMRKASGL